MAEEKHCQGQISDLHSSLYSWATGHKLNKEARVTLALLAKGVALCTPSYDCMPQKYCNFKVGLFIEKIFVIVNEILCN